MEQLVPLITIGHIQCSHMHTMSYKDERSPGGQCMRKTVQPLEGKQTKLFVNGDKPVFLALFTLGQCS